MSNWFINLGITESDLQMLEVAPILGLAGSVVRALMIRNSLESLPLYPTESAPFSGWFVYARLNWYLAWAVVGAGSGLLVTLLFLGAVPPGSGLVRVYALAMLAGYGAPALWKREEATMERVVDERLSAYFSDRGRPFRSDRGR